MEPLQTDIFRMGKGKFACHMMSAYGKTWISLLAVMFLVCVIAGLLIDLRWIVVALMVICILAPMLLAFLYFYYGMSPAGVVNVIDHSVEFTDDGLKVSIYTWGVDEETGEAVRLLHSCKAIPYSSIHSYVTGLSSVSLRIEREKRDFNRGFIWIPVGSFPASGMMEKAMEKVASGIRAAKTQSFLTGYENTER